MRLHDPEERPAAHKLLASVLELPVELDSDPSALSVRVSDAGKVAAALAGLARADIQVVTFALGQPSLDEVFLSLTGRPAEAAGTEEAA